MIIFASTFYYFLYNLCLSKLVQYTLFNCRHDINYCVHYHILLQNTMKSTAYFESSPFISVDLFDFSHLGHNLFWFILVSTFGQTTLKRLVCRRLCPRGYLLAHESAFDCRHDNCVHHHI